MTNPQDDPKEPECEFNIEMNKVGSYQRILAALRVRASSATSPDLLRMLSSSGVLLPG